MNFKNFENNNLGFHYLLKDIESEDAFLKTGSILRIEDVRVRFWRKQYDYPTYRIDLELTLFEGEKVSIVLYQELDSIETLSKYYDSIFKKTDLVI